MKEPTFDIDVWSKTLSEFDVFKKIDKITPDQGKFILFARDMGYSFENISFALKKQFNISVSESTIRRWCVLNKK